MSDDQPEDDSDYRFTPIPPPAINIPGPSRPTSASASASIPLPNQAKLNQLIHGLRPTQQVMVRRVAGILDAFDWENGTRRDFLDCYTGVNDLVSFASIIREMTEM